MVVYRADEPFAIAANVFTAVSICMIITHSYGSRCVPPQELVQNNIDNNNFGQIFSKIS
jgi:hypothetical protein